MRHMHYRGYDGIPVHTPCCLKSPKKETVSDRKLLKNKFDYIGTYGDPQEKVEVIKLPCLCLMVDLVNMFCLRYSN